MISKNPLEIAQKLKENYENKRNFVFFSPAAAHREIQGQQVFGKMFKMESRF